MPRRKAPASTTTETVAPTKTAMKRTKAQADGPPAAKVARVGRHAGSSKIQLPLPERPRRAGNLLACGQGDMGQLGMGDEIMERSRPALLKDATELEGIVVDICAGGMHSLALTKDGDLYSFGCNDEGALGRDSSEEGSEFVPKKIELPGKCLKVSAGDSHSACLLEDGRVFAWGSFRDSHGNMGLTLEGNKRQPIEVLPGISCVDIASGTDHLVILTEVGDIYTLGCAEQGQLGRVSTRSAGGESRRGKTHLLEPSRVLINVGKVHVDAIWATNYCTFARAYNKDNVWAFGLNNYNQLGFAMKSPVFVPKKTPLTNVQRIEGGQHHTLVLKKDHRCYVIGRKEYGRLGIAGVQEDLVELSEVSALEGEEVVDIAAGECQSFAVTAEGKVYAWGMGSNQQLGNGSEEDALVPELLTGAQVKDKKVVRVSSGGQHTLFLVEAPAGEGKKQPAAVKEKKNAAVAVAPKDAPKENSVEEKKKENAIEEATNEDEEAIVSSSTDVIPPATTEPPPIVKVNGDAASATVADEKMETESTSSKGSRKGRKKKE